MLASCPLFQGLELYINWIAGAGNTHDVFYTDSRIIASYRKYHSFCNTASLCFLHPTWTFSERYVKTLVERYKDSPAIFAWELVNEARCSGDILPAGPNCVPGSNTLYNWYKQQSDYVRSL